MGSLFCFLFRKSRGEGGRRLLFAFLFRKSTEKVPTVFFPISIDRTRDASSLVVPFDLFCHPTSNNHFTRRRV